MGDMAEDFRAMREHNRERRGVIEPHLFKYAKQKLDEAGHTYETVDATQLLVNGYVKFWPFTGWYAGKGIGSGRGIRNLIKALG